MRNLKKKKKKNTIPKHIYIYIYIFKKKPTILIRVIKKNKNSERERESTHNFFFGGKNMDWNGRNDIKFIQIKWEEEESSYKKEKMIKEV